VFLAPAAPGAAEEKKSSFPGSFSGSLLLTNDYVFRGISQSDDVPAIQGSIDWAHDVGAHLGIWASNVKFTDASIEIDYTAGFGRSIDKFSWDLSAIYYQYPGAAGSLNYDFWEIAPSVGYDFGILSASLGANYSPEYFGDSGDATYLSAGIEIPLGKSFALAANVGHQWIDKNANFGTDDYLDWGISLSAEFEGFTFSVGYTDTDLSDAQCAGGDSCGILLFSISRSF
jgi:uncharacterized protein (TIGR02001 family)